MKVLKVSNGRYLLDNGLWLTKEEVKDYSKKKEKEYKSSNNAVKTEIDKKKKRK